MSDWDKENEAFLKKIGQVEPATTAALPEQKHQVHYRRLIQKSTPNFSFVICRFLS